MDELQLRRKPKILLTSFSHEEKINLSSKIRGIGGILYKTSKFTPLATHVVCKLPSRSEKFICACASGKWILSQSFIDESYKQNGWLDEKPFEWSSSDIKQDSSNKELFLLPRKWREQHSLEKGAFNQWNVVLMLKDTQKREAFKRLIEAGGGKVMNIKTRYHGKLMEVIKYVISDDIKSKNLLSFKRSNVPIIDTEAIIDYIIKGTKIDSAYQGAIVTKGGKIPSPQQNERKKSISSSLAHSALKDSCRQQGNRQRQKQTSVTAYFTEMKNDYCPSPARYTHDSNGDDSANKRASSVEKCKTTKREKNFVPFCERLSPSNKNHLESDKSVPNKKMGLKELNICISNYKEKHLLNSKLLSKVTCEKEVGTISSPTEKNKSCKVAEDSSFKKNCSSMDSTRAKQKTSQTPCICTQKTPSQHTAIHLPLLEHDAALNSPVEVASAEPCKQNIALKIETIKGAKPALQNQKQLRSNVSRKRLLDEEDIGAACGNDNLQSRTLRSEVKRNTTERQSKKPKVSTDSCLQKPDHLDCARMSTPLQTTDKNRGRMQLHSYGTDMIESCLEEGLRHEAIQLMENYLCPTFYLTPYTITVLLKFLELPPEDFDEASLLRTLSLLNRCITLHPPQAIPDVYSKAFKMAGKRAEVLESNCAFEYITSVFRKAQDYLLAADITIRKQSILGLVKFIATVLETDFNFHWKRFEADSVIVSDSKPILDEVFCFHVEQNRRGTNVKNLINLTAEILTKSVENHELVPLRTMAVSLLNLVAQSCQMSDMRCLSTMYGQACTDLTNELYEVISNVADKSSRGKDVFRTVVCCLRPSWLSARLADNFISAYDASCVRGKARLLLRKPLSLEKIVSCYFLFIPTDSNGNLYYINRKSSSKPLAVRDNNNNEVTKMNIKDYSIPVKRNVKGETKLHVACIKNRPAVVKDLLLHGMDPNVKDNAGWTPLHEASNHGHRACVAELLTSKDLDVLATGPCDYTALHDAAENNHLEVVRLIVKSGGIPLLKMKTDSNATALDLARTTPMKDLLFQLENDLHCECKDSSSYPAFGQVNSSDIYKFLILLEVLLRHYIVESNAHLQLPVRAKLLKDHINKIQEKKTKRTTLLLNVVSNLLLYSSSVSSK